jgi:hypothetical protein
MDQWFSQNEAGMRQRDLPEYLIKGLGIVFETAAQLLRAGRAPTVDRIKSSASQAVNETHHFARMLQAGGKVEFALDALFNITENGLVDDEDFKDQIEAHRPHRLISRLTLPFSCAYIEAEASWRSLVDPTSIVLYNADVREVKIAIPDQAVLLS